MKHISRAGMAEEDRVEALSGCMFETQPTRGIGLRVEIDEQDAAARLGGPGGQMDGGGGFADPSLLIHNGYNAHRKWKRRRSGLSRSFLGLVHLTFGGVFLFFRIRHDPS